MPPHELNHALYRDTLPSRSQNGYLVATISGELDIACVPTLREQLLGLLGPHASRIVIDLSGVTFCDASGLAVLVGTSRRAWLLGGVLRLAAPAPPVVSVLRLTGLDSHFEVFATVSAATVSAAAGAPGQLGVPDPSLRRQVPMSQLSTRPASSGGPPRRRAGADNGDVHKAVTALLAQADAWRDADPDRRLTRPLRALAGAHASADGTGLIEAARSLLAGLLRHPLTHSPAVAATATELRRLLAPAPQPAAAGRRG
jgi:anti-sigma B factor antagonist